MPYNYQDWLEEFGLTDENPILSETFSIEVDKIPFNENDAVSLFPELADVQNQNVIYAPVRMCHSLPFINRRGRCFTAETLKRSVGSVGDNLINFDHEISDNGLSETERICGHLKGARIGEQDDDGKYPMYALATLYARHPEVKEMAKEHLAGDIWSVSMECGHNILKSHLLLEDEFIPFKEAKGEMIRCVKTHSVEPYKGKKLSLAVGGKDGLVNFWGMALTKSPADENGNILSMFSAAPREVANFNSVKNKKLYFPIRSTYTRKNEENVKKLTTINDNLLREAASIEVIGKTEESHGHSHEVLSDGTIMPENDHSHFIRNYSVTPGKEPTFSLSLGEHDEYSSGEYERKLISSHSHKCIINLRKQNKKKTGSLLSENANLSEEGEEMSKILDQLKKSVNEISELASVLKPKEGDGDDKVSIALRAVKAIEDLDLDRTVANAVEEDIKEKVDAGEFISKEDHEAAIESARKEEAEKINLEHVRTERKASRIAAVKEAGINPEDRISEEDDAKTVQQVIDDISLDDAGENFFQSNLAIWKSLKGVKKEVASEGKTKKKPAVLAAGAGKTGEAANTGKNKPKFGKNALTVV